MKLLPTSSLTPSPTQREQDAPDRQGHKPPPTLSFNPEMHPAVSIHSSSTNRSELYSSRSYETNQLEWCRVPGISTYGSQVAPASAACSHWHSQLSTYGQSGYGTHNGVIGLDDRMSYATTTGEAMDPPSSSLAPSHHVQKFSGVNNPPWQEHVIGLYTFRQQQQFFREALTLPIAGVSGPFIPQQMYKSHTSNDKGRYMNDFGLDTPIFFWMTSPDECGIPLIDALHSRVHRLRDRNLPVFGGRGPSISLRLEWPGYRHWSRQIPTKDFRSPPGPITLARLAKNVATCLQRFIEDRHEALLEDDADECWRVSPSGQGGIKLDDIVLVSMYHVSLGSWQPQLRLKRPLTRDTN